MVLPACAQPEFRCEDGGCSSDGSCAGAANGRPSTAAAAVVAARNTAPAISLVQTAQISAVVEVRQGTTYAPCDAASPREFLAECEPGATADDGEDGDLTVAIVVRHTPLLAPAAGTTGARAPLWALTADCICVDEGLSAAEHRGRCHVRLMLGFTYHPG